MPLLQLFRDSIFKRSLFNLSTDLSPGFRSLLSARSMLGQAITLHGSWHGSEIEAFTLETANSMEERSGRNLYFCTVSIRFSIVPRFANSSRFWSFKNRTPGGKERCTYGDFNSEANLISNILIYSYLHQSEVLFAECALKYKFNLKAKHITSPKCSLACLHPTAEYPRKVSEKYC